jgi:uncharacterized protein
MKTGTVLLAALALGLSCAAGSAHEIEMSPTIAVGGHGEVTTTPDRARLSLAVDAVNDELKIAEANVNRVVRLYLDELERLGIADTDIATTSATIQPELVWDEKERRQKLVGYRVRRDIQLLIRDLAKLGDVILQATRVGVNHVSPPQLESSREEALSREALAKAAANAKARAATLAQALGVELGAARIVRESVQMPPPVPYKAMAVRAEAAYDAGGEMGVMTGEIRIGADVSVEFDIAGR